MAKKEMVNGGLCRSTTGTSWTLYKYNWKNCL